MGSNFGPTWLLLGPPKIDLRGGSGWDEGSGAASLLGPPNIERYGCADCGGKN